MPSESYPRPSWRPTVTTVVPEEPAGPRWRREVQSGGGSRWPRRLRALALLGAFLACTGLLIWASFWLFPPQPACLVLVGAGYETNLAVPANVHGREGMKEIQAWAKSPPAFSWRSGLLTLKQEPIELQKNGAWDTALGNVNEKTVVVYFAMHGACDSKGPYLIRQDADGGDPEHDLLRVTEVLDRLKKLPASKNKVLIFDATQVPALWSFGVLHNEFARGLEQLDGDIEKIPNLIILSASGPDQRSWASDDLRRTIFSYYVLEGLKGAADQNNDGRIDALELQDWVSERVNRWVKANRDVEQTPVLLPSATGRERARHMLLTMVPKPYQSADPAPSSDWAPPPELAKAWDSAARLAAQTPAPEVYSPQLWQQYRATLLRYEQLLKAGDADNAASVGRQLPDLERQIERANRVQLGSAGNTLTMAKVAGAGAGEINVTGDMETLWGADDAEMANEWAKVQSKWPADLETRQARRLKLLSLIVARAAENPRENLIKARQLTLLVSDPAVPRPAESHFLVMLAGNLPQNPKLISAEYANLIALALKVRLQAEAAALGLPSKGHPYSERVRAWIGPLVREADEHRARGQDLLFIRDPERWVTAQRELHDAEAKYAEADRAAQEIAAALAVRDQLFAELPAFTQAGAAFRANDNVSRDRIADQVKQLEAIWNDAHTLAATLDGPPDMAMGALKKLSGDAQKTLAAFAELRARIKDDLSNSSERESLDDWYEIDASLAYPSWPTALRMRSLAKQRAIEQKLMRKTEFNANRVSVPSADVQQRQTLEQAERQGKLALAVLGEPIFAETKGDNLEPRKQVAYLIDNLHLNESWWKALTTAGDNIGRRWQALTTTANDLTTKSRLAELKDARTELQRADELTRQLDGTSNARLSLNPAGEYRRVLLHDLLLWQAGRTLDEHWFAENDGQPGSKPYYQEAGRRYADDAQKMVSGVQTQTATAMLARLNKPDRLVMPKPPTQVFTSERTVQLDCQLQPPAGAKFRPGFVVLHVEPDALLNTSFTGEKPAWVAELKPQDPSENVALHVTQNLTMLTTSHKELAQVKVRGFFRGQVLEEDTPVELHPLASKVYYEYPLPVTRAVAVRTSPQLQAAFGDGTGSIAIVLDCSGSMGSDQKNPTAKTKWDESTQALEEVLAALPRGTTVSIWVFGQAVSAGKTVANAEDTIARILEPTAWNPENAEQLPALMKKVHEMEPWNESPIVQTILAAKDDLAKAKGYKSIVVLTDGYDNRFGKGEKSPKSIATTLREAFQDSGIVVNVVGFKFATKEEEDLARRQFKVLETLTPPGQFFATNESSKLAAQLREAMRQRLRYWIDREDHEKLPEVPDAGLELSAGGNDRWFRFPQSLPAGGYKMRVDTNRRVLQNVIVNRGDLLLLDLLPGANGVEWRRTFVTRDDYGNRPGEGSGDWRLAALQNQRVEDRGLQMLLMLDKAPEKAEATLQMMRPREAWVEVESSAGPKATFNLRWGYQPGYAAAAWNVKSRQWPTLPGTQTPAKPLVRMWWSPVLETPADAFVARSTDLPTLLHAANVTRPLGGETVVIDGVEVETHSVETQPGKFEDKRCLVVRVTYPSGNPVKVRVEGVAPAGQEQSYYPEAGKLTALFWPVDEAQARDGLSRINLISINRFKSQAEKAGHYILLDKLNEPQTTDVRPQTPIEMKYE